MQQPVAVVPKRRRRRASTQKYGQSSSDWHTVHSVGAGVGEGVGPGAGALVGEGVGETVGEGVGETVGEGVGVTVGYKRTSWLSWLCKHHIQFHFQPQNNLTCAVSRVRRDSGRGPYP